MGRLSLRQRVMRDMSSLDTGIESLGQRFSMPVGLSPVGMAGMYARRGEVAAAQAAAEAGIPFSLSTVGICSVEEVARNASPPWFQLYVLKDRGYMRALVVARRRRAVPYWCSPSTCRFPARAIAMFARDSVG